MMQRRYGRWVTFATILLLGFGGGFFCRDAILRLGPADVSELTPVNEPATEEDDAEVDAVVFLRFSIIPHSKLEAAAPRLLEILDRDQLCPLNPLENFFLRTSDWAERRNVGSAGPSVEFLNGFERPVEIFGEGPQPFDPFSLYVLKQGSLLNLTIDGKSCRLEHQGGCLFRVASPNGPVILLVSDYL